MKTFEFFWNYFKVYKISFVVVITMIIIATVAQALFPVFSGQAVTELANLVLAYQNGTSDLAWQSLSALMLNLALVVLALVVSSLIYMTLMTRVIAESTNEMRKGLFGKLSRLTVSFFDRHQDGDILSRFTSDLDNILQAFNESLVQVMSNIALYIGLIFVMFSRNVTLALITVASTPVAFLMLVFIVKMARKYTNLQQKEVGKLNAYMDESISGQKAVIVQGIQDDIVAGFVEQNEQGNFQRENVLRHPLSSYEWDEFGQYGHRYFCRFCGLAERSKYRNNDSPRFDCHVYPIFSAVLPAYYPSCG